MKKNSLLVVMTAIAAMTGMALTANAQSWNLAGNNNAGGSSKLGTTNSVPLRLFTNNKVRMYIDPTAGNVAIGNGNASNASYRLYVKGAGYGIYGTGTNYGIVGSGGSYGVYGYGTTAGLYGYSDGTYGTYSSGGTYGVYATSTDGYGGYASSTNGTGFYGNTDNGTYGIWGNSSNSSGYGVVGIGGYIGLYGNGSGYGSYNYGGTYGSYNYGTSYGSYGYSPSGYGVYGDSYDGLGGYFHSTNNWALEASTDNGTYAGVFYGYVYASQGFVTSDRRLKKNVEDFGNAMSIINKLKPKHYEFNNDARYAALHLPPGTHYGLVAQDLEQVLPNLVHEETFKLPVKTDPVIIKLTSPDGKVGNQIQKAAAVKTESVDVKAVNYEELIPIMIKAMQEQNEKIEALTQQVNALTASKQSVTNNASAAIKLSGAYLAQSVPNPAVGTASIRYNNLPAGARAQLFVSDANGKMIKQMQLSNNSGIINLDVSSLSAGTYTYSLLVNGKLMESKTMQVAK